MVAGLTFRTATHDDLPWLRALTESTMRAHAEAAFGHWPRERAEASLSDDVAANRAVVLFDGDLAIGLLCVREEPDRVSLDKVFLAPSHQRRGLGSLLVQHVMARAKASARPVRLRVLKANPAKRLYDRLGFAVVETDDYFYFMEAG